MLPVQIRIVSPLRAVTLTNQNMSFALRRVESSWKSCFKSNYPLCHCEDVGSKRSFGDTIKEWCSTILEPKVLKHLLHTVQDLHVPSQVASTSDLCECKSRNIETVRNHMKKKQEGAVFVCGYCHHCRCVCLILQPV